VVPEVDVEGAEWGEVPAGLVDKCALVSRRFAVKELGLDSDYARSLEVDCEWLQSTGRRVVLVQCYDPMSIRPDSVHGLEPRLGGFPAYFTVLVDTSTWEVVDHYASDE